MAKVRAKTKKTTKKKIDPLAISLKLLALAVRESMRAIRFLNKAIMSPVQEPKIVNCTFKLHKKRYRARVTVEQAEKILAAVGDNSDVLGVVTGLLSTLTKTIVGDLDEYAVLLGIQAKARARPMGGIKTIPVGCCIYSGGSIPNLTQSQCQQYNPTKWDQNDPNCTNSPR